MVRCTYCERKGAKLRVMLPLRVLARLPRVHVHVRCASAFPCLVCVCLRLCAFASRRVCRCLCFSVCLRVCSYAWRVHCGFAWECGICAGLWSGVSVLFLCSQLSVFAYWFSFICILSLSLFWGSLCLFFLVSLQVTPYFFTSFL